METRYSLQKDLKRYYNEKWKLNIKGDQLKQKNMKVKANIK